jgi:hypothetical protein
MGRPPAIATDEAMVRATVYNWVRKQQDEIMRRAEDAEWE